MLASEGALSSGVRRVTALTGGAAMAADMAAADLERRIAAADALAADALLHEVNEITKLESSLGLGLVARALIAPQLAARFGLAQLVVGLGKVVHPDRLVPRAEETLADQTEQL